MIRQRQELCQREMMMQQQTDLIRDGEKGILF
jgi:hypothetical protein